MNKGLYTTEALILRCRRYREADGLLALLTRERGKVHAVAKGIFKPSSSLRGGVQTFTLSDMQLYAGKSNLHTVTQSQCQEAFLTLREQLDGMLTAACWAELLETLLPEEEADEALFALALTGFYALSVKAAPLVRRGLEVQLMNALGYEPVLDGCVECQSRFPEDAPVFFSLSRGGLVCRRCRQSGDLPVGGEAVALWRMLGKMDCGKVGRIKGRPFAIKQLGSVVEAWIAAQVGRPMRSWGVIKTMGGLSYD
jgi:DNA repair protein RecO (recombination protein O)